MDQEKIGKFILKCRKELNMTQQDLANKLGVTDKAVSKWENGRCLMDISMLKPLSEILNVSIVELINGEKMEKKDIYLKTDETIKSTLDYSTNKIKNVIKSIVRVLLMIIILLVFLFGFVIYKVICANDIYYVSLVDDEEGLFDSLSFNDEIEIYNKKIDDSEYLVLDNLKIRNDFKDFEKVENNNGEGNTMYLNDSKSGIIIGTTESYINEFITYSYDSSIGDTEEVRREFLIENGIENDIDLFKFIRENYYMENYWYNSISDMRDNYLINSFVMDVIPYNNDGITIISGDYDGYIINYSMNDESTCDMNYYRVVNIIRNDKIYFLTFINNEKLTDEYIKDILSTLLIDE